LKELKAMIPELTFRRKEKVKNGIKNNYFGTPENSSSSRISKLHKSIK
jgi:hypothetical protein